MSTENPCQELGLEEKTGSFELEALGRGRSSSAVRRGALQWEAAKQGKAQRRRRHWLTGKIYISDYNLYYGSPSAFGKEQDKMSPVGSSLGEDLGFAQELQVGSKGCQGSGASQARGNRTEGFPSMLCPYTYICNTRERYFTALTCRLHSSYYHHQYALPSNISIPEVVLFM